MSIVETALSGSVKGSFTAVFSDMAGYRSDSGCFTSSPRVEAVGNLWSVRIYPTGKSSTNDSFLSCYLVNESEQVVHASYSMVLVNEDGETYGPWSSVGTKEFTPGIQKYGVADVCSIKRRDRLTVHVTLSTFGPQIERALEHVPGSNNSASSLNGRSILMPLLSTGLMSDFRVMAPHKGPNLTKPEDTQDLVSIPVHKLILSLCSPVLKAMLESGMSESSAGELRITDTYAAVVREFVRFLYTGSCTVRDAESLLALAHRYEVFDLQRLCEHSLQAELTAENFLHVLSLADLYSSVELRRKVLDYFSRNGAALLKSRTFLVNLSPELCQELLCAAFGVKLREALPTVAT
jgi:hypothetical protein